MGNCLNARPADKRIKRIETLPIKLNLPFANIEVHDDSIKIVYNEINYNEGNLYKTCYIDHGDHDIINEHLELKRSSMNILRLSKDRLSSEIKSSRLPYEKKLKTQSSEQLSSKSHSEPIKKYVRISHSDRGNTNHQSIKI
jgi:hypothetical protein